MKRGPIDQSFTVTATVVPLQRAHCCRRSSPATCSRSTDRSASTFSKGDLLVKIDDSTLQAQLTQDNALLAAAQAHYESAVANATGTTSSANAGLESARINAESADATLRRDQMLLKQGYVSQQAVDQQQAATAAADAALRSAEVQATNASLQGTSSSAEADLRNAKAAVDSAAAASAFCQAQIAQTNVRAPFDGVIVFRAVDPGSLAAPGTTLMDVDQLDHVYVDAGISGDQLRYVHRGTPVTVTVSSVPGRSWHGAVEYFDASAEPGTVCVSRKNHGVGQSRSHASRWDGGPSGIRASARKSDALLAPTASVYQTDTGCTRCSYFADGKATVVPVQLQIAKRSVDRSNGPRTGAKRDGHPQPLCHTPTGGTPVSTGPPMGGPPGAAPGAKALSKAPTKAPGGTKPKAGSH